MLNYFKVITGAIAITHEARQRAPLTQEFFFFDDSDAAQAHEAKRAARMSETDGRGRLSVWRRTPTVPSYVPVIGEWWLPPAVCVLQPGQATATRNHSTPLVAEAAE